ncbi:unnamed protein product [Rangifer tarandus platyrhynchus]|uniref:Uncharacterized protein n=1 Tax=Rangifer tarandus platyrhynchus TaxID=3082113 RepID=A0ABN8XKZ3_RANTA|nr:unnamed protein product [Rangifer tarandus platyrhynchus]
MRETVIVLSYSTCAVLALQGTNTVRAATGGPPPTGNDETGSKDIAARDNDVQFLTLLEYTLRSQTDLLPRNAASLEFGASLLRDLLDLFLRAYDVLTGPGAGATVAVAAELAHLLRVRLLLLHQPLMEDVLFGPQYYQMLSMRVHHLVMRLHSLGAP